MRGRILAMGVILGLRVVVFGGGEEFSQGSNGNKLGSLRGKLVQVYGRQLPEPEAGLVAGVVLGAKSSLEKGFQEALIKTGTVHVVVASGYNVVVVGSVVLNLLIYFMKRRLATIGAVISMLGYALLAGGEPPVVRAVIMAGLVFMARAIGRMSVTGWLLFLAGFLMLLFQPLLLTSVSFQLSMAATAGLVWIEPRLREIFEGRNRWIDFVFKTELSPTLAAQITTGPIIWWHFGRLSLISPLVNVLVLPLVPVMMGLGAVQLLLVILWRPLGLVVAPFTYSVAHLFVWIVEVF